jgi:arylsulfatase A-like enzyme
VLVKGAVVAETERPNVLVIWGDDIGITNLSSTATG